MNAKRIFALIGALLLLALYVSALIFAVIDHPASDDLLQAAILCTVAVPVMIYAMILVWRVLKKDSDE